MCSKKINIEEGQNINHSDAQIVEYDKTLNRKSSESLKNNLKEYYKNSPSRKNKVIVAQRRNFFNESMSDIDSEKL